MGLLGETHHFRSCPLFVGSRGRIDPSVFSVFFFEKLQATDPAIRDRIVL